MASETQGGSDIEENSEAESDSPYNQQGADTDGLPYKKPRKGAGKDGFPYTQLRKEDEAALVDNAISSYALANPSLTKQNDRQPRSNPIKVAQSLLRNTPNTLPGTAEEESKTDRNIPQGKYSPSMANRGKRRKPTAPRVVLDTDAEEDAKLELPHSRKLLPKRKADDAAEDDNQGQLDLKMSKVDGDTAELSTVKKRRGRLSKIKGPQAIASQPMTERPSPSPEGSEDSSSAEKASSSPRTKSLSSGMPLARPARAAAQSAKVSIGEQSIQRVKKPDPPSSVFHVKSKTVEGASNQPKQPKKFKRGDSVKEWAVDKIVNSKVDKKNGKRIYEVKWKGFAASENTWEPESNLTNCADALEKYRKTQKNG